jgi:hypothetical protein
MSFTADKSFGRRQAPAPKSVMPASDNPYAMEEVFEATRQGRSGSSSVLRGLLAGVGIVALSGAIYGFVYLGTMSGAARLLDRFWTASNPDAEEANKSSAVSLERIHNDCKSRADYMRLGRGREEAMAFFPGLQSVELALAKSAYYVSCLATEQPERFCKSEHRTHLVAAIKDYFRVLERARGQRAIMSNGPFAAVAQAMSGERNGEALFPPLQTDARLVGGLRKAITDGYLAKRDLSSGFGTLGDLDTALRGVEPRRSGCA